MVFVTERFILNLKTQDKINSMEPNFGFNGLGALTYYRTYSRIITDSITGNERNEHWGDTVIRVVQGIFSILKNHYIKNHLEFHDEEHQEYAEELAVSMFKMEFLPPGRSLFVGGTDYVYNNGSLALNNCASISSYFLAASARTVTDMLMSGTGIGFSCDEWTGDVSSDISAYTYTFVIPDSREGWADSIALLIEAYVTEPLVRLKGGRDVPLEDRNKMPVFDYSEIRAKGEPIRGFGGTASGSEPLEKLHKQISAFLTCYIYTKYDTISRKKYFCDMIKKLNLYNEKELLEFYKTQNIMYSITHVTADIMNCIGACVIAGNVRRCIPIGYLVHTNSGKIPIEEIRIGMEVLTNDGYKPVVNTFNQGGQQLSKIKTQNGYFECTPNHRMAVLTGFKEFIWVEAQDLKEGDKLISDSIKSKELIYSFKNGMLLSDYLEEQDFKFCPVGVLSVELTDKIEETYDIEIEDNHNFFCNGYLVHNSAMIAVGKPNNETFWNLKNTDGENKYRDFCSWMSNNSVAFAKTKDFELLPKLATCNQQKGEPGMINLKNFPKGRMKIHKETPFTRESEQDKATLMNPCGEICLEGGVDVEKEEEKRNEKKKRTYDLAFDPSVKVFHPRELGGELCNLSEVMVPRCVEIDNNFSKEKFLRACYHATFYASTVSLLLTSNSGTNEILSRNRRIGVSLSGIAEWQNMITHSEFIRCLRDGYKIVRETNRTLARNAGVPESIRVTTIKPSGSISLLSGCSPGCHDPTFRYYIRRIRVGDSLPICKFLIEQGLKHEPDSYSQNTMVFEFPVDQSHSKPATEVSAFEQLKVLQVLTSEYCDNSCSKTVYFSEEEKKDLERIISLFAPDIKSVSFLPHTKDGVYKQAPYSGLTKEEYDEEMKTFKPINWKLFTSINVAEVEKFCTGITCEMPLKK